MTWLRLVLAAWVILAGSSPAYAATAANHDLERIPFNVGFLVVVGTSGRLMRGSGGGTSRRGRECTRR